MVSEAATSLPLRLAARMDRIVRQLHRERLELGSPNSHEASSA